MVLAAGGLFPVGSPALEHGREGEVGPAENQPMGRLTRIEDLGGADLVTIRSLHPTRLR